MPDGRPRTLTLCAALCFSLLASGCEREPGPTPSEVCDWLNTCFGPQPASCEKALIPAFEQAAESGCGAELADYFECLLEQNCKLDHTACEDESGALYECNPKF